MTGIFFYEADVYTSMMVNTINKASNELWQLALKVF
jgi:hypothetical protein